MIRKAIYNEVKIVIGSWGSYNAGNSRAMGSKLITLSDYDDWEEIEEELTKQGFQLDGIDEELFVQDIENLDLDGENTDYMSPRCLFETLYESGVLLDANKFETMEAFIEARSYKDFEARVKEQGECWDDDVHIYKGYGWEEYGREQFSNSGLSIPDSLIDYFDFESYGESFSYDGVVEKYSGGLIEIY